MWRCALTTLPGRAALIPFARRWIVALWMTVLAWLGAGLVPCRSLAWTETVVTDARAHVALANDGAIAVRLTTELRVKGGYLTRFELTGLPADLELDSDTAPTLESLEGTFLMHPEVHVIHGGLMQVDFGGPRQAPKRGRYRLTVAFMAHGVVESGLQSDRFVRWRVPLPAWETNLENVVVAVDAPLGSRPGPRDWLLQATTAEEQGHAHIVFRRSQLPRTVPMDLLVDVPTAATPALGRGSWAALASAESRPQVALVWLLLVQMLALLKLGAAVRRAGQLRHDLRFVVPGLPPWLRALLGIAMSFLGIWPALGIEGRWLLAGVAVVLVLQRHSVVQRPSSNPKAHCASPTEISALRWRALCERFDGSAMLDLSAPAGVLVSGCLALLMLMFLRYGHDGRMQPFALMTSFLFVSGTRRFQPWSVADKARNLLAAQRCLADVSSHILLSSQGSGAAIEDVRLGLSLETPAQGLLELSLVAGETQVLSRRLQTLCWLVIVEADSEAHRRILDALPQSRGRVHRSRAMVSFLAPMQQPQREAQALRRWLLATPQHVAYAA